MITAIIVASILELARGRSGNAYGWLEAIAGIAYPLAIVTLRIRGEMSCPGGCERG